MTRDTVKAAEGGNPISLMRSFERLGIVYGGLIQAADLGWRSVAYVSVRFAVALGGYLAAVLVACVLMAAFMVIKDTAPQHYGTSGDFAAVIEFAAVAFPFVVYLLFFPAGLIIVVGEVMSLRNKLYYVLSGGFLGLLLESYGPPPPPSSSLLASHVGVASIIIGCASGFIYWLLAGRTMPRSARIVWTKKTEVPREPDDGFRDVCRRLLLGDAGRPRR
ncbi:hypothetical protein EV561_101640 [Rhizobium sp. BK376]|nr:hypothetical protein EV561_101640 [Rhizobium sp. BK376]